MSDASAAFVANDKGIMMGILSFRSLLGHWEWLTSHLRGAGEVIPGLAMRAVMGWEFWESGLEKLNGENWFAGIQNDFPFPFNVIPADLSWAMATWAELIGAVLLWLGLATRFSAFSLLMVTFVATAAVHWPDMWTMWSDLLKGYAITDDGFGNFKLPLLFTLMLLPLIFNGAGKLSMDHGLALLLKGDTNRQPVTDAYSWALAGLVLGLPCMMLLPKTGIALLLLALASFLYATWVSRRRDKF